MRIVLRTSGGRGEYEISGSQGNVRASHVVDHHVVLEFLPGQRLATHNYIRRLQGKTRLRLQDPHADRHIYLIVADALLLPKPKREIRETAGGNVQLAENNYSVSSIRFDIVLQSSTDLVIQPTDIIVTNSDGDLARIDVIERMKILIDVWAKARLGLDSLSLALVRHHDAFVRGDERALHHEAIGIRKAIHDTGDPLRQIVMSFGLIDQYTYWVGVHRNDAELSLIDVDQDRTDPKEAAKNRIKAWRQQAMRGSGGQWFSQAVKAAYDNTCLFTGYYLPKTTVTGSAGVDSAHILPWASYELNEVKNGLCLSKLCHWGFDVGILALDFDSVKDEYSLLVTKVAGDAEKKGLLNLSPFHALEGPIPQSRLPKDQADWPSPSLLREYNRLSIS
jgi:hypothetical protein